MAELVKTEFSKMEAGPDTYVSLRNSINASKTPNYVFHYNAPVFIVVANQKGYGNAMADSACALENMMIAANALDLGSCWINQLHWLDENENIRAFIKEYGLGEDETMLRRLLRWRSEERRYDSMANTIDLREINKLIKEKFYIPTYQRGYRWDTQQVTDLLEDVYEFNKCMRKVKRII